MFFRSMPDKQQAQVILDQQAKCSYSYDTVGMTASSPPTGYMVDHNRSQIGCGAGAFATACDAIRRWQMFEIGWINLLWPNAPLVTGTVVGVVAQLPGVFVFNVCRIVYVIDEISDEMTRFGFAYGTLPNHVECGEERFLLEWRHSDDTVWYDILAFSQPNHWLVRLGYPVTRFYQKRFARASLQRMVQVCQVQDPLTVQTPLSLSKGMSEPL